MHGDIPESSEEWKNQRKQTQPLPQFQGGKTATSVRVYNDQAWQCKASDRDLSISLGTQFHRIIEATGLVPWQQPLVNSHACCRTDLEEKFPGHVIDGWLGHSSRIAAKHYLQTTDEHWVRASSDTVFAKPVQNGGVTGGVIDADQQESTSINNEENHDKDAVLIGADNFGDENQYAQQDSNLRPTD